jgi:very-short-patch-repair endonuclease
LDRIARTHRAQELRQTDFAAAKRLWGELRNRKLDGLKFRREHPILGYFADFACIEAKLVIELDGLSHDEETSALRDEHREREIEAAGWQVIRFRNPDVFKEMPRVLTAILAAARPGGGS